MGILGEIEDNKALGGNEIGRRGDESTVRSAIIGEMDFGNSMASKLADREPAIVAFTCADFKWKKCLKGMKGTV